MSARDDLRAMQDAQRTGDGPHNPSDEDGVMFDARGKLLLPEVPAHDNHPGLCRWLTVVFNLNPRHPITSAAHEGLRGPEGHVAMRRVEAPPLRFEPAARLNNPAKLIETVSWQKLHTDGMVHALKAEHCRQISHVARMLCGITTAMRDEQEADAIVSELLHAGAVQLEGHTTYGTSGQRYEAAMALRREVDAGTGRAFGPARCLLDVNTGELVIAVSDLAEAARRHVGSSLPRGWLDARMEALGWARVSLDGHQQPGRGGRQGPHARINAYRGIQPGEDQGDPTSVTT